MTIQKIFDTIYMEVENMRLCINNYSLANDKIQEIRFPFRMMNEAMDYSRAHKDKKIIMEIYDLNQDKMPEIDTLR